MLIRNVTDEDLDNALRATNEVFGGNVGFFHKRHIGHTRQGGNKYDVRLTVRSSRGPGAARSYTGRRLSAACWHVHGTFFDALPPEAEIISAHEDGIHRPGDCWFDYQVGSMMQPMYASEACDCRDVDGSSGKGFTPNLFIPRGVKEWRPK
jgi:hypothetical protein